MSRLHVVIADADSSLARSLETALESRGFVGHIAVNGDKAFELIAQHEPQLVVSDILLPGFNGFQLCRRLRDEQPELPVLLFARRTEPADTLWAHEVGARELFHKPKDLGRLVEVALELTRPT